MPKAKNKRIVFMGTPGLASYVLSQLQDNGYNVVAVVTAPDKPAGRGRKLKQSPVKQYATDHGIPILQPTDLKDPAFIGELAAYAPDLQVVVAFRLLPREVWSLPAIATFNLHASLLPDYRGAAPINWVIINGERETGVTTFLIDEKIDTGQILFRRKISLQPQETAGSLHERIKPEGALLVMQTIDALIDGNVSPVPQEHLTTNREILHKAPKISKEDCRICWHSPCHEVVNHIHGLSPQPGAFCEVSTAQDRRMRMKILKAMPVPEQHDKVPGQIMTDNRSFIRIATPDGLVEAIILQLEGKKAMPVKDLLRGTRFENHWICIG